MMATWKEGLEDAFEETGDSLDDIETTLSDDEMTEEFYAGYGGPKGTPFTAWSDDYVYFPVQYDGSEWVGYVPRHPNGEATRHWGGG